MTFSELFAFKESFSEADRVYMLSFNIPAASAIWSLFNKDTVSNITEDIENNLLKRFDTIFEDGHFIFLYSLGDDDELAEETEATVWEYQNDHEPSELLGTWDYSRIGRFISLAWNVPGWFQRQDRGFYIENFEDIYNPCKDWYINSP